MGNIKYKAVGTFAILIGGFIPLSVSAQNLVTNGSFELGDFNNSDSDPRPDYMLILPGMNNITGWSVSGDGGVHWMTTAVQNTADGDKAIDLQGVLNGSYSSLSTAVPTLLGARYILSFDGAAGNDPNVAEVSCGSLMNHAFLGIIGYPSVYTRFQYGFTGLSSQSMLVFHVTASDGYGPVIDDVTVTEISPPGDYNFDGAVDSADYVVWRKMLGQAGNNLAADGNLDGNVDAADYQIWRSCFGTNVFAPAAATADQLSTTVPEPTNISMAVNFLVALILGILGYFRIRQGIFLSVVFVLLIGRDSIRASTITYVGVIDNVGASAATVYGVDGYDLYSTTPTGTSSGSGSAGAFGYGTRISRYPAYISSIVANGANRSAGGFGYLTINNPLGGTVEAGFTYRTTGTSDEQTLLDVVLGPALPSTFYIGLLEDTSTYTTADYPEALRLVDSSGGNSNLILTAGDRTFGGDLYFFQVENAPTGDSLTISEIETTLNGTCGSCYNFVLAGLVFTTSNPLPGDYNWDGSVDSADYVLYRRSFGQTGDNLIADGNLDGKVDDADYQIWRMNFGTNVFASGEAANVTAVPEPPAIFLVQLLTLVYLTIHRKSRGAKYMPRIQVLPFQEQQDDKRQ